jgi:protoporphyrinogen oxidase
MSHSDVFVIGAGPAGLTAAYLLTKRGVPTTVIEADPAYVGGISRTASYKDFLFDIGGHRFFSKSKEVVDLWREILPGDFIERPRLSRIYYNGSFFSYPLKAFEALNNLGYVESALCMLSYLHKQAFPTANPESFHDWVANQFGERLFSIFFKTYTEKVWGMSCDEISADWAAQRIKGLDLWTGRPREGARRPHPHGHAAREPALEPAREALDHRRRHGRRGMEGLLGGARRLIGADPRAGGEHSAGAGLSAGGREPALPRFPDRGADRRQARPVSRQLDLHP